MKGRCKLCLRDGEELRLSHYLPAAVYRAIRGEDGPGLNPNPVNITQRGTFQTSAQKRAHLLCGECEQRFSQMGEHWFFRNSLQRSGRFPLAELLAAGPASVWEQGAETTLYEANRFPQIDSDALAYFGTSIFWRGSIHGWNDDGSVPVNLHGYADQFRRYLLGEKAFPENASLTVVVRSGGLVDRVVYGPVGMSRKRTSYYRFPIPGFSFMLTFGPRLTERERRYCIVRGLGRPIIVTSIIEQHILRETRQAMGVLDL